MSRVFANLAVRSGLGKKKNRKTYYNMVQQLLPNDVNPTGDYMAADQIQKIIDLVGSRYGEQSLYNFAFKKLSSKDPTERKAAYKAIKNDVYIPKKLFEEYTKQGTQPLNVQQAQELIYTALARKEAYEKARNAKFKRDIGGSTYSSGKKAKVYENGQLRAITNETPLLMIGWKDENNEIRDLVERDVDLALVEYHGDKFNVNKFQVTDKASSMFNSFSTKVILNPQLCNEDVIMVEATNIAEQFRKENVNNTSMMSAENLSLLFKTLKSIAPLTDQAESNKESIQRSLGKVMFFYGSGQNEAGLAELLNVTSVLTKSTNALLERVKEQGDNLQELKEEGENRINAEHQKYVEANSALLELQTQQTDTALKLKEYEYTNKELKVKIENLEETSKNLQEKIKKTQKEHQDVLVKMEKENKNTIDEKSKMNAESKRAAEEKLQKLVDKYDALQVEKLQIFSELEKTKREKTDCESKINSCEAKLKTITGITGDIGEAVQQVISLIQSSKEAEQQFKDEISLLTEVKEKLQEKNRTQAEELIKSELKVKEQLSTLKVRETEISTLKGQLEQNKAKVEVMVQVQNANKTLMEEKAKEIARLKASLRNKELEEGDMVVLNNSIKSLQSELNNYIQESEKDKIKIEQLKGENAQLETKISGFDAEKSLLESQIASFKGQIQALNEGLEQATTAEKTARDALAAKDMELQNSQAKLSSLTEQLSVSAELESQIKVMKSQVQNDAKLKQDAEKEISRLKVLTSKQDKKITELEDALEESKRNEQSNRDEYEQRLAEAEKRHREEMERADKQIAVNENEMLQIQREVERLQNLKRSASPTHISDVIESHTSAVTLPLEASHEVAGQLLINAGRQSKPFKEITGSSSGRVIIPEKAKIKKRVRALAGVDITPSKRIRRSKGGFNSVAHGVVKSRARNTTSGGYVVGGRPDPYISPQGTAFWKNVYKSHYHLF